MSWVFPRSSPTKPPDLPRDVTVARAPKDLSFGMEAAEAAERGDIGSAPQLGLPQ